MKLLGVLAVFAALVSSAGADIVISEIHYHPVEEPTFNADGTPVYDLSSDIHEFVEIQNTGAAAVDLSGYQLGGGIDFAFPSGASIPAGGFKVIAKMPARIEAVYALASGSVLGPYTGSLGNNSDTVRVRNASGDVLDAVTYDSRFPWAQSADALGAQDRFTGLTSTAYNFKGRSLQRVSVSWSAGDPANWLASPLTGPTPGAAQAVTRTVPKPVVIAQSYAQSSTGLALVRASSAVTVNCTFSATSSLSAVTLEYFVDDVNSTAETRTSITMTDLGGGKYTATIPGQADKSVVRYRFKANRGDGLEVVSPRADDPQVAPVGTGGALESWFGYFVTPVRTSTYPIYDILVSTAGLTQMNTNITQTVKRVTAASATGIPRDKEALLAKGQTVTAATPLWNGTVAAVFACDGILYDVQVRYHGSRYHRAATNHSFKLHFPEHLPFNDRDSWFVTGHGAEFMEAQKMNRLLGLPSSQMRNVSWYFNANAVEVRGEQGEYDNDMLDDWADLQQQLNPGSAKEARGELYKTVGNRDASQNNVEGPYTKGDIAPLAANAGWTQLQRYEWTHSIQSNTWKGSKPIRDLMEGLWTVRGDSPAATTLASNATNLAATKAWFQTNFDVDTTLTSMALLMWMSVWDDQAHNQFWWRRANGKWVRLGWDYDQVMATNRTSQSPYSGEVGVNVFDGTNWWKDTFFKCFRAEFNQRLWELNNSFCDPVNLTANGLTTATTFANAGRTTYLNGLLTSTFGTYYKPARPTNTTPATGTTLVGATNLVTSAYSSPNASAHASTRWEIRSASGTYEAPVLRLTSLSAKTTLAVPFDQLTYGQTYYWRATYIDAAGHSSNVSAETSFTWGTTSTTAGTLVINEVLASNKAAYANGNDYPDCIELRNNGATALNIGGYALTDDPLTPAKYTIPTGTTLAAGGYLVLFADNETSSPGLHTGFTLDADGEQLLLLNGTTIVDSVTFGPQAPDVSIGRITNGTGGWQANTPTIGLANSARTLGSTSSLRINEWMANPAYGEDWFELYNADANPVALAGLYVSDTPSTPAITALPALSFIAGKGHLRLWADGSTAGGSHTNFKLATGGESLVLSQSNGSTTIDTVTFGSQTKDVSQGRLPDGGTTIASFANTASPAYTNWATNSIVINEVLAHAALPFEDAIELLNTGASAVNVGGWWLSDDFAVRQKFQIPAGTTIPSGGYLVIYENQLLSGAVPFSLNARGDEVLLSAVDGTGAVTGYGSLVRFGPSEENVSFGRVAATGMNPSSGGAEFWRQTAHSFGQDAAGGVAAFRTGTGAANSGPALGPVTINEVMYHPPDVASADYALTEFIEVYNTSAAAVDLSGARLKGDVEFIIPSGASLPAGGYALFVSFDPVADTTSLATFKNAYALTGSSPLILGPYSPRLANSTMSVEIAKAVTIGGSSAWVNLDKVEYRDTAPWPTTPDGGGKSLQRASSAVVGNSAANWTGNTPTPAAVNVGVVSALSIATTSPLVGGVVGVSYAQTLTALNGSAPYAWTLTTGSIPGLALSSDGTLSGLPTSAGTFGITVRVTDSLAASVSKTLSVTIAALPLVISAPTTLPGGVVNATYSSALAATGGTAPYTWTLAAGTLPSGLALSSAGELAGTPTQTGVFLLTLSLVDGGGLTATKVVSLTVSASPLVVTSTVALPAGLYNTPYAQALTASGGTAPYTWTLSAGSLPAGVTLSTSGDLSGTPLEAGEFSFTVQLADGGGASTTKTLTLAVAAPPLSVATSSVPLAIIGESYAFSLSATGGVPPYGWTSGTLPPGLELSAAGALAGVPTITATYAVTFTVTDHDGRVATATLSVSTAASGPLDHYSWDYVPTTAYSGIPFAVRVTARDGGGRLVGTAGGAVSLAAESGGGTRSPVLITELCDGAEASFELQNVTGSAVDTTGWFVLVGDSPTDINTVNGTVFLLPSTFAASELLRVSEAGALGGRTEFGGPINWNATGRAWILLFDEDYTLRDAIFTGWTAAEIATFSVDIDGEGVPAGLEWMGDGLVAGTRSSDTNHDSFQRTGARDDNSASGWVWRHAADGSDATSPGVTNAGLALPWSLPVPIGLTPATATLGGGSFTGYLTADTPAHGVVLGATDAIGVTGSSAVFQIISGASASVDGLPDVWKSANGVSNAAADDDGDGVSNLDEFLAGTDPRSASSRLEIRTTGIDAGRTLFSLGFPAKAGRLYQVSSSTDLVTWTPLTPLVFAAEDGERTVSFALSGEAKVFFRVEIAP